MPCHRNGKIRVHKTELPQKYNNSFLWQFNFVTKVPFYLETKEYYHAAHGIGLVI
jgi:hypothetical protein